MQEVRSFDFDGVIFLDYDRLGFRPEPNDIIITGRSFEEIPETLEFLKNFGINNTIYFNPLPFDKKTRESSGKHKADTIRNLKLKGNNITLHIDDDEVQIKVIQEEHPDLNIILVNHNLVSKENERRDKNVNK